MIRRISIIVLSSLIGGLFMWIEGGLWHNLIQPLLNVNAEPHHNGLLIMLIAYFILAFLMTILFTLRKEKNRPVAEGLILGILVGILWVFPHGLAMAGEKGTSIFYEIKNTLYHIAEQGLGGLVVAFLFILLNKIGVKNEQQS